MSPARRGPLAAAPLRDHGRGRPRPALQEAHAHAPVQRAADVAKPRPREAGPRRPGRLHRSRSRGGWSEEWAMVWIDTGAGQPAPEPAEGASPAERAAAAELASRRKETDQRVLANLLRLNPARAGREASHPTTAGLRPAPGAAALGAGGARAGGAQSRVGGRGGLISPRSGGVRSGDYAGRFRVGDRSGTEQRVSEQRSADPAGAGLPGQHGCRIHEAAALGDRVSERWSH
jgi:hypothetical protein